MKDPAAVATVGDTRERARAAHALIEDYQAAIAELSRIRREALEQLLVDGMTQAQIADLLDMSRSRVSQLLSAGTRPERAFLGTGRLTVAIGGKQESGRHDPGDMLSAESFAAYNVLADLARTVGLDANYEVVPPPGFVHLNRPNLIVLTSPRLLPFVGQVMEADPHLRFASDERGWYLIDGETEYRSPRDDGQSADYGYIGRLPRPDGKGSFLYLAGTHAQGTLGAAHFVANHLAQLHKELKSRRFSMVVRCEYDPANPRKVLSCERVTPIYRHES
ncbi:sigma factor-like helix-turn-helix DNA-binding protein [Micromonospora haikouensis]|uniref:sigma factor-like helix-turn-helix DNA-binding protein n=1 Tax=Micromonospora haikouensis TaxID=686309 RepID=UPI0036CBF5B2